MYYNFGSSVAVSRSFLTTIVHHARNLPSISTLRYLMKKFERAGSAKYSWKGKKLDSKEETVKCCMFACGYTASFSSLSVQKNWRYQGKKYMEFFAQAC